MRQSAIHNLPSCSRRPACSRRSFDAAMTSPRLRVQSFVSPAHLNLPPNRCSARHPRCRRRRHSGANATPTMIIDPSAAGTGYVFLESLKGVVIGPTVNEVTAAFAGGTVGVMGTIIALEVRRHNAKERKQCPYCRGRGKLPCANCFTVGSLPSVDVVASQKPCTKCNEKGFLQCNHCDGDGRLIPWAYERAIRAQYEDYVYTAIDDYFQDGPPYI